MLNKMYYLVANPEDRVSRDMAHFQMVYQFKPCTRVTLYKLLKLKEKVQVKKWTTEKQMKTCIQILHGRIL